MLLLTLRQLNFRNLLTPQLDFSGGLTVITGPNGAGKSNLLAACYLAFTAELPFGRIADAVRLGEEEAFVSARFSHSDGESTAEVGLGPGRRAVRLDGQRVRADELAATAAAVLITPDDVQLVHGAPAARRAWLDSLLKRISRRYARLHAEYGRVVTQRNALLRHGFSEAELSVWTDRFVLLGSAIEDLRLRAVGRIRELAAGAYLDITAGTELPAERRKLGVRLRSEGREPLAQALAASRQEETARGVTVVGPHRDDLELELAGSSLQAYGSRGEARTAALALKLAEFRLLAERHAEEPLLLLDDFTAELDPERRRYLLRLASSAEQVLATATELPAGLAGARQLLVERGNVRVETEKRY